MDTSFHPEQTGDAAPDLERLVAERTQELQLALDQAQSLYEHAPCGYLSLDANHRFVKLNQTLLDWLGYSREEALGQLDIFDLIDPSWRPVMQDRLDILLQSGRTEAMELEVRRKDGSRFHALFSSTAVRDADGNFLHGNTTLVDISERRAAEQRVLAKVNGNGQVSLSDFLFDPPDPEAQARQRERDMRYFFKD
jgi:PAS domain S-box-containing protein